MWNKFLQFHQRGPDGRGYCKTIVISLRRRAIYQDFGKWLNQKVKIFGFFKKEILVSLLPLNIICQSYGQIWWYDISKMIEIYFSNFYLTVF